MMRGLCGYIFFVTVTLLLLSHTVQGRLDCTKFVFAPRCRGVAAKRSHNHNHMMEHKKSTLASETLTLDRFASPEDLKALEESYTNSQSSRQIPERPTRDYPKEVLADMKFTLPNSIRDLVDMYRIRWQHTQQTGVKEADKWRHLLENSHNNGLLRRLLERVANINEQEDADDSETIDNIDNNNIDESPDTLNGMDEETMRRLVI